MGSQKNLKLLQCVCQHVWNFNIVLLYLRNGSWLGLLYLCCRGTALKIKLKLYFYAGCPEGAYRVLKRVDFFFFFFVVYTNRYINLFIKLSPLLLGMYCFDCLQQKQANQNPFLSLILRGRGPTHPYLCDVNASFDIFIKDGLSRAILF